MSSVPHLPMATHPLRTGRTLLAAGLLASALSGCSIWPKALTWGSDDAPPQPAAQPVAPPPAPPVVVEEAPKPSPAPVPVSTTETAPLEPQPVMKSTPVMAPPEPAMAAKAPAKGKGKEKAAAPQGSAKAAAPKSSGGDLVPGFYINVGLFAVPTNGTNAFRTLEKAELPVFTDVVKSKKGPLTRVRVGPYLSKALADAAAEKIKGMKLEAVVFQQ
ncbi:Sporulation-like domain containing protein [Comamonadaceae bacterium]